MAGNKLQYLPMASVIGSSSSSSKSDDKEEALAGGEEAIGDPFD